MLHNCPLLCKLVIQAFLSCFSSISPETEAIVKESIKNGLPIIPFASPSFYESPKLPVGKYDRRSRNDDEQTPPRDISDCREVEDDNIFLMDHDEYEGDRESLSSLNAIVRRAKNEFEKKADHMALKRKESQSSYVEMNFQKNDVDVKDEKAEEVAVDVDDTDYFMMDNSKGAVGALKKHSVIHNSVPCDLFR